jgi:hypothetical protein
MVGHAGVHPQMSEDVAGSIGVGGGHLDKHCAQGLAGDQVERGRPSRARKAAVIGSCWVIRGSAFWTTLSSSSSGVVVRGRRRGMRNSAAMMCSHGSAEQWRRSRRWPRQ